MTVCPGNWRGSSPARAALEVEVVGRLVEQQQVGLREQHAGQRHAHPPAAGKGGTRHVLLRVRKAEALEDRRRPRLRRPGVDIGKPRLHVRHARAVCRLRLRHQRGALGIRLEHGVDQRHVGSRHLLRHAADARARRQGDLAAVKRELPTDQSEERRLAGAVGPDEPDLVPVGNGGGGAVEERMALDGVRQGVDTQHARRLTGAAARGNRARAAAVALRRGHAQSWTLQDFPTDVFRGNRSLRAPYSAARRGWSCRAGVSGVPSSQMISGAWTRRASRCSAQSRAMREPRPSESFARPSASQRT